MASAEIAHDFSAFYGAPLELCGPPSSRGARLRAPPSGSCSPSEETSGEPKGRVGRSHRVRASTSNGAAHRAATLQAVAPQGQSLRRRLRGSEERARGVQANAGYARTVVAGAEGLLASGTGDLTGLDDGTGNGSGGRGIRRKAPGPAGNEDWRGGRRYESDEEDEDLQSDEEDSETD